MAASAQILISAPSPSIPQPSAEPAFGSLPGEPDPLVGVSDPDSGMPGYGFPSVGEPPLTSEPPLADAAPLTSEPPLAAEPPLTSEPTAAGTGMATALEPMGY